MESHVTIEGMISLDKALIVDDHPLFREALNTAVAFAYPKARCYEAASINDALNILEKSAGFDIALVDLKIPGVSGFDGLIQLRTGFPRLPILVVSGLEDAQIIKEAISFGAAGYVAKSVGKESLAVAINTVLAGDIYLPDAIRMLDSSTEAAYDSNSLVDRITSLTPQQLRVLTMLREGLLNKQIAHELRVGDSTIKKHVSEILRKLQVNSRTQAVIEVSKLDQQFFAAAEDEFPHKSYR